MGADMTLLHEHECENCLAHYTTEHCDCPQRYMRYGLCPDCGEKVTHVCWCCQAPLSDMRAYVVRGHDVCEGCYYQVEVGRARKAPDLSAAVSKAATNAAIEKWLDSEPDPEPGATKHDDGKPPLALLPPHALEAVAQVLAFGANKYGRDNWRGGFKWMRLGSAALRHVFSWLKGQDADPESGLPHLAHAATCILFLLEYQALGLGDDDRPEG